MSGILAISGSLRSVSINSALLRAVRELAPNDLVVELYDELGELPLFNPDLEGEEPAVVKRLWQAVGAADCLVIASPEYAHGVTGAMKNCLDWLVGGPEFVEKPVVVLNAAPRAHHALEALKETIRTMNGYLLESESMTIPIGTKPLTTPEIIATPEFARCIRHALDVIVEFAAAARH
jgi:NAD(P)H-dependent FMN reductase